MPVVGDFTKYVCLMLLFTCCMSRYLLLQYPASHVYSEWAWCVYHTSPNPQYGSDYYLTSFRTRGHPLRQRRHQLEHNFYQRYYIGQYANQLQVIYILSDDLP